MRKSFVEENNSNNNGIIDELTNHDIILREYFVYIMPGREKSSMRNYDNMTDEEFISAYDRPFSQEEKDEMHEEAIKQYNQGRVYEFTDELIDEIFADETV